MLNYPDILLQDIQDGRSTSSTVKLLGRFPHPSYAPIETGLGFVAITARISR